MKILYIIFFIFFSIMIICPEVIIKNDGNVINGKIIKMDEDTITVISSENELIIDKEEVSKIYYSEKQYEEEKSNINNKNPQPEKGGNIIIDGNFRNNSSLENWQIWTSNTSHTKQIKNGELVFKFSKNIVNEKPLLFYPLLEIELNKKYQVKFKARAEKLITTNIEIGLLDREIYHSKTFTFNKKMREYKYSFEITYTVTNRKNCSLLFIFDNKDNTFYLDDIEIIEIN